MIRAVKPNKVNVNILVSSLAIKTYIPIFKSFSGDLGKILFWQYLSYNPLKSCGSAEETQLWSIEST